MGCKPYALLLSALSVISMRWPLNDKTDRLNGDLANSGIVEKHYSHLTDEATVLTVPTGQQVLPVPLTRPVRPLRGEILRKNTR